ncbi:hypothetical protein GCM10022236_53070 [Microlunatus ginsengisoli]|uniref:Uncharacterized protein n=1 Tax=Microlunatus ginsengisoli TaxID=363863 RepID=A0ABP7B087_9ACTN
MIASMGIALVSAEAGCGGKGRFAMVLSQMSDPVAPGLRLLATVRRRAPRCLVDG